MRKVLAENSVFIFWVTAFFADLLETALLFFGALIGMASVPPMCRNPILIVCVRFSLWRGLLPRSPSILSEMIRWSRVV